MSGRTSRSMCVSTTHSAWKLDVMQGVFGVGEHARDEFTGIRVHRAS